MVASPSSSPVNFLRKARSSVARANSETFRPRAAASPVPWEFLLAPHSSAGSILRKEILLPLKKLQSSGVVIANLGWLSPKCVRVSSARLPICAKKSHRFKPSLLSRLQSRRLSLHMVNDHGSYLRVFSLSLRQPTPLRNYRNTALFFLSRCSVVAGKR